MSEPVESDVLCVAGNVLYSKTEVEDAVDIGALIRAKAANMRDSFIRVSIDEINKRGWATVEYMKNTSGAL